MQTKNHLPHTARPASPLRHLAIAAALCVSAPAAFAQAFDVVRLLGAAPDRDSGRVGAVAIVGPKYMGSDETGALALPALDYQWRNGWFAGTGNGIGYNFSPTQETQYGLRVTADIGRRQSRSDALNGMGNVNPRPEVGGFLNYAINRQTVLTSSLRYGAGNDSDGLVVDLGVAWSTSLAPMWRLGLGVTGTVVNSSYMQSYFGVTPAQSASSGYAAYTPGSGWRDVRANAALTWQINPRTVMSFGLSASTLLGSAKDSPLTLQTNALSGVVAVLYGF